MRSDRRAIAGLGAIVGLICVAALSILNVDHQSKFVGTITILQRATELSAIATSQRISESTSITNQTVTATTKDESTVNVTNSSNEQVVPMASSATSSIAQVTSWIGVLNASTSSVNATLKAVKKSLLIGDVDVDWTSEKQNPSSASKSESCKILITNKIADHHHEVLESIALRFPVPWDKLNFSCHSAGLDRHGPIIVDYMLSFVRWVGEGKKMQHMEAWGWKIYFEEHLQGRTRNRTKVDGRVIRFGNIVGNTKEEVQALDIDQYAAQIEASCDKPIARLDSWKWMMEDRDGHYCVLHGLSFDMPQEVINQTCQLNPMHSEQCWFIPSHYPEFPHPAPPYVNGTNLTVCIPTRMQKDPTPLIQALKKLRPSSLAVIMLGRRLQSKVDAFSQANLSHYLVPSGDLKNYWTFQERISQCHVLVPLVEPSGESLMYFIGKSPERKGQLTGFVSQMIGNRIPGVVHTELANIYRAEFTAPIYEYNTTSDGISFLEAFKSMLESFLVPSNGSNK